MDADGSVFQKPLKADRIGTPTAKITVELGASFLEHFSEQLYSSPQKAFEELISNSWDAGASYVDVRVADELLDDNATLVVYDNGSSMNLQGIKDLWTIARSPKKNAASLHGRPVVGKFGIGKLATYVLASELTYLCKASDGIIRRVTMDYSSIDAQPGSDEKLLKDINLDVFEVSQTELDGALLGVAGGADILKHIKKGAPAEQSPAPSQSEFGGQPAELIPPAKDTWTVAILSRLKPTGRELRLGVLRRMLEAVLPLGSEMYVGLNGQRLESSKLDASVFLDRIVGPDLGIDTVEVEEEQEDGTSVTITVPVTSSYKPVPHISIPGVGMITGRVRLFKEQISGVKSDELGASNGFHVNVLGRVVNQDDPSFGEENLSHAAWARFRMAVRADGLTKHLVITREKFKETKDLKVFRALLRKAFNICRSEFDSDKNAVMPDGGDLLVRSLGVPSLSPLRNVVSTMLRAGQAPLPGLFDIDGIENPEERRTSWIEETADNIRNALGQVKYEKSDDPSLVRFRVSDNAIIVNRDHPFVLEHSRSKAEKELMRTIAMVNLLTDVYSLDIGITPDQLQVIRDYRDRLLRYRAMQNRQSGMYIAQILQETQHDPDYHLLEKSVSSALTYLGYAVDDLAKPGQPEGLAKAFPLPTQRVGSVADPRPPLYSFTFDAKSTIHSAAKTGNIDLAAVTAHRDKYKADYALVIAPGYQEGDLVNRLTMAHVTAITATDLGHLLEITFEHGALPLTKLREIFSFTDPAKVHEWVQGIRGWLKQKRSLTFDVFLKALDSLKGKVPDSLAASTIAFQCREVLNVPSVTDAEVIAVATGLSILVPDLVGVDVDKIIVNASAERVAAAVAMQLEALHNTEVTA